MASSKSTIKHAQPKRGQIKIKILKMFANSLQKLAKGVAEKQKKAVGTDVIQKKRPMRGQIKVKIFKMTLKSIKNLGKGVFVGKKKAAGKSCLTSPATVIPVYNVGEMEVDTGGEKGKIEIEIKIWKTIGGSVIEFADSGGKKKGAVGGGKKKGTVGGGSIPMAGVLPVGYV